MVPSGRGPIPMSRLPFFDDDVAEHLNELGLADDVLDALVAVGAEGVADAACQLPLARRDTVLQDVVLGRPEVVVLRRGEGQMLALLGDERPQRLHHCARDTHHAVAHLVARRGSRQRSLTTPSSTAL